ncbi:unnamed protein product [Rangifer tarandus platyrhynchus]|uniref:Uncharacterized protein n=1 Tax=Rangifer tarandus platyrhynchus TaxID=3082113 RepID=A0AC59ZAS7_RANTA
MCPRARDPRQQKPPHGGARMPQPGAAPAGRNSRRARAGTEVQHSQKQINNATQKRGTGHEPRAPLPAAGRQGPEA